jgi:hypothetical protein
MSKITHPTVTRETVWSAFRGCHEVHLRERYHAVLLLAEGHTCPDIRTCTAMKTPFASAYTRSMTRNLRACNVRRFRAVRRNGTRSIVPLSRRCCGRAHARSATL